MLKGLNIGCGPLLLKSDFNIEWENSDFADTESSKAWRIDKKRDFTKPMDDIEDNSIDFIVAWHIFEHMGFPTERDSIINEWKRVLKPGGKIALACPDVSKIAKHIVDRNGPWQDWFICMVNIFGPYNGFIGDVHRWGYNDEEAKKLFIEKGFSFAETLMPDKLASLIGGENALRLPFADYNVQILIEK